MGLVKALARAARERSMAPDAQATQHSGAMVIAVEEPELYLHPQAQRSLSESLRLLAEGEGFQVMLCSHSPHFIHLDHYQEVAIASKRSACTGTEIRQCTESLFDGDSDGDRKDRFHMAYWVNPDRGELFFAKRVIFVEGETEKTLFPYLAQRIGCHRADVSVIDCGSKNNLPLYIAIAKAFRLDFHVVHDEDGFPEPLPADWTDERTRSARHSLEYNMQLAQSLDSPQQVSMFRPYLEQRLGIPSDGKRKGKPFLALEHFKRLPKEDLDSQLVEVVRTAYGTL